MELPDAYIESCSNEGLDNLILKRRDHARNLERDLKLIIMQMVESMVVAELATHEKSKRERQPTLVKAKSA